ncbi:uncharacterized protein LOC111079796 [Drosophila obscura]|uniref:uncharacterized protein LOC111079796 n=1 Tax=Drosophila obscura TaxID=7282 RepID=UPI001BB1B4AB|nr:uncharacterized protein LOC111079796 [Drosophila obscura]
MYSSECCSVDGISSGDSGDSSEGANKKLMKIHDNKKKAINSNANSKPLSEHLMQYLDMGIPPGPWLRCRHILVHYGPRTHALAKHANRSESQARKMIENARRLIVSGRVDFAAVAMAISECCSARKGGDIGIFKALQVRSEFRRQVLALNVNELSPVFSTTQGLQLVLRTHPTDDSVPATERAKSRRMRKISSINSIGSFKEGLKRHAKAAGKTVSRRKIPEESRGSENDDDYSSDFWSPQSSAMHLPVEEAVTELDRIEAREMKLMWGEQLADSVDNLEYKQQQRWIEDNLCEQIKDIQLVKSGGTRVKIIDRDDNGEIVVSFQNMIITKMPKNEQKMLLKPTHTQSQTQSQHKKTLD